MKLSDKDKHALIGAIASFNVELINVEPGDDAIEVEHQVELNDADFTLLLTATLVPRGAFVKGLGTAPSLTAEVCAEVNRLNPTSPFKFCPHGEMTGPGFAKCGRCP